MSSYEVICSILSVMLVVAVVSWGLLGRGGEE